VENRHFALSREVIENKGQENVFLRAKAERLLKRKVLKKIGTNLEDDEITESWQTAHFFKQLILNGLN
jgi:hypothetical protein